MDSGEAATDDPFAYRRAGAADAGTLVRLRDDAARWMIANGIEQWQPGEKDEKHFLRRVEDGEVWLASLRGAGTVVGAWELWWSDPTAWGVRPDDAAYVHRLMVDRAAAPRGAGRLLLAAAERRIAELGLEHSRLDCVRSNPRLRAYYESAGYVHVGEGVQRDREGNPYPVTLLEKRLTR
ncbi:GNAT family N-acetyltransferase [Streptomyces sp. XM4193]|uniref:GNAT family N-acetyltransferase n=1 Tax=Streptomyces sp. XM4193 TaxID=2929782 RepID=UPI001FFA98BF|nr:GNAT family N-acetyltransferase [Streptomyces sp. XM4193]MCK1794748.1 GNAT family N-acetyltransferase [Streptomyces sp. XM4193]